jgi:hypothetical protein
MSTGAFPAWSKVEMAGRCASVNEDDDQNDPWRSWRAGGGEVEAQDEPPPFRGQPLPGGRLAKSLPPSRSICLSDEVNCGLVSGRLARRPHVVFYRVMNDILEIIRVLDGRQDIEDIFADRDQSDS